MQTSRGREDVHTNTPLQTASEEEDVVKNNAGSSLTVRSMRQSWKRMEPHPSGAELRGRASSRRNRPQLILVPVPQSSLCVCSLTWARAGLPALGSVLLSDSSSDSSRPRAARRPGTGSPSRPPLPATERPGRRVPGILGLLTRASLLRLKGRSSTSERRADDGVRRTETLHLLSGRPAGEGVVVLGRRAAKKLQDTKVDLRGQLDDPLRKSLGDLEAPR
ncbi:hypothetical protein AGIG_G22829 [Arapaima gigas]